MRVLVSASTFPSADGDGTPRFIHDPAEALRTHAQVSVLARLLLGVCFFLLVADLISVNRRLLEKLNGRVRTIKAGTRRPKQEEFRSSQQEVSLLEPAVGD